MKMPRWAIAAALVSATCAGAAHAQVGASPEVRQPGSIQQMAYRSDEISGYAAVDPAPAPAGAVSAGTLSNQPPAPATAPAVPPVAPEQPAAKEDKTPKSKMNPEDNFFKRFAEANYDVFYDVPQPETPEPYRRALPAPWTSPPFPGHEWQGYPLVGVPPDPVSGVLMTALTAGDNGEFFKNTKINVDGWATASGNWSSSTKSNTPDTYWVVPNAFELDQAVMRFSRNEDTVQCDHVDWGFKSTILYGMDYREMVAGGWGPGYQQLLFNNDLYGLDFTEIYGELYLPPGKGGLFEGSVIRLGRWIACPDIEVQYSPDNYLGSHSLLFTYDTYTQTGCMYTTKINMNWMVQGAIIAGTDMAPWYPGAVACGFFGLRWESTAGKDAVYTCLNDFDSAQFRHLIQSTATYPAGTASGHDNYNYIVSTWEHKFNDTWHTATEGYFMWQYNAVLGGTPSLGPYQDYGNNGGTPNSNIPVSMGGSLLPGLSKTYGLLNYTEMKTSPNDYFCFRNEWWDDARGMRSGYAGVYTSHTLGFSHNFNSAFQVRPEIGYYRNWTQAAFDDGTKQGQWQYGFDVTYHW
jgi:hypothetical protein